MHDSAALLIALSAAILLCLGLVHLFYTFIGPKLTPRNPELLLLMQQVEPVLTRETTMWKAWVGFNASHSLGAIFFGCLYGWFALNEQQLLSQSPFLVALGLAVLISYAAIGRSCWFSVPNTGIAVALLSFAAGTFLLTTSTLSLTPWSNP